MRRQIIGRLIGLAVIEFVIGVSWLFGVNRMLVMVAVIGLPLLAFTVALPIVLLIRSKQSPDSTRPLFVLKPATRGRNRPAPPRA
jgi:hypothetical protein